jgi:hypothetical protein
MCGLVVCLHAQLPQHRDRIAAGLVPIPITLPSGTASAIEPGDIEAFDDGRVVAPAAVIAGDAPALAILVDVAFGESAKVGQLLDLVDDTLGRIPSDGAPIQHVNQINYRESYADRRKKGLAAWQRAPQNRMTHSGGVWRHQERPPWNAADWALASLHFRRGRRVLVVVTDGIRRRSLLPYNTDVGTDRAASRGDFHDRVRQEFATVFAVGVDGAELPDDLRKIVAESGGDARSVGPGEDLRAALTALAQQITNQRVVYFTPANPDGRVHRLHVRLKTGAVPLQSPTVYRAPRPTR